MRDELVGEDGTVDLHFDEVDGQRGDLGLDDAADGVGEGEVGARELEIDLDVVCLSRGLLAWGCRGGTRSRRTAEILTVGPPSWPFSIIGSMSIVAVVAHELRLGT